MMAWTLVHYLKWLNWLQLSEQLGWVYWHFHNRGKCWKVLSMVFPHAIYGMLCWVTAVFQFFPIPIPVADYGNVPNTAPMQNTSWHFIHNPCLTRIVYVVLAFFIHIMSCHIPNHCICNFFAACRIFFPDNLLLCYMPYLTHHCIFLSSLSPPLDNIWIVMIVWRLRGNIIRTALCWIVWHNVRSQQHTYMSSSYRSNRLGLSHWNPYTVHRGGCLEWFWWDSSLISTTNWFPSVLWRCWFGHLACKNRPRNDL